MNQILKKIIGCCFFCLATSIADAQAGKYAGTQKWLIGKKYTDSRSMPGLKGWQYRQGTLISAIDEAESVTAVELKKASNSVIVFAIKEDPADSVYVIVDVLELRNIPATQKVIITECRNNKNPSVEIVALANKRKTEWSKAVRAWRFNRDKRRIEAISPASVDCLNEDFDMTIDYRTVKSGYEILI